MEIYFNDQLQQVEEQSSVRTLLDHIVGEKQKGIAVAVNQSIVPRTEWENRILQQYDKILVIKATQGG
jgi:sulfur carrier protein